ncbi:MAG: putative Ig domain-containing protein [Planctomycetes bacterium]|nr:putative Ig domain-containing protein [Planctomycetota bacterium]
MRHRMTRWVRAGFVACVLALAAASTAWAGTTPYAVQTDSVSDSAFTVSWVTTTAETGYVEYGTSAGSLGSVAYDTRGSSTSANVHSVVITGLSASSACYWKIVSGGTEYGDGTGAAYQTTTGSSLILLGSRFVTGQVLDASGNPASSTLVHVTLRNADGAGSTGDSQRKTVLTDSSGNWLFLLESFRTANLTSGFSVSTSGDSIVVTADGGALGMGASTVDTSYASSSPTTITTTLVAPGVPVVSAVAPSQGTNTLATDVTLTGSNFLFATSAALDDGASTGLASFTVVSDTTITARVPSGVAAGAYNLKVTAWGGTNTTSFQKFTAAVPPSITDTSLTGWTVGQAYSRSIGVTGGAAPLTWSVTAGALPAGITLSSTGLLSGTPTASGTASFTVQVRDASNVTASQALSLSIAAAVTAPTGSLPDWTIGRNFGSRTLDTTGGTDTVTWTITGLPPGLAAAGTGRSRTVSGTPISIGNFTVTAMATDSVGSSASTTFGVSINGTVTQPTGTLPDWTSGRDYGSRTVTTTGGTDTVTWTTSGLPTGLSASGSGRTLTISGTPTATGSFSVVTTATDAAGSSATKTFSFAISAPVTQPTGTLPDWTSGRDYGSRTVTTTGGTDPVTWTATGLPPGLTATPSSRTLAITGTPTTVGSYSVVATATDAAGSTAAKTFAVTISAPLTTPTGTLPDWTVAQSYGSRAVTTTGGTDTISWTTTGVPPGLTATGIDRTLTVSGTPTTAGTYSLVATTTDAAGATASQTFAIVVNPVVAAPVGTLPGWTQGRDYGTRAITSTGGTSPIAWTVVGLPPGLLSTASDRTLTVIGTPNQTGSFGVTITATDNVGSTASSNWTIVISAPLTTPTGALPDWTVGQAWGNRVLTTTGGTDPVTWTATGLPPGTSATPSGRNLTFSGTPTTAGTYAVNVGISDGTGSTASRVLTVVINPPLTALLGSLPDWTVGRNYGTRTVTTTGGTDPIVWTTTNLPSGLTASGSGRTLTISGFPDTAAPYALNVTAMDAAGAAVSRAYSIVINPALSSPTGTLPDWTVGRDIGSRVLTTTGGTDPIDWSVTGLPAGLIATPTGRTLTVTGTPTTAGTYSILATVSDGAGGTSTRSLTMVVSPPVTVASGTLPDWTVGRAYGSRSLTTTGGTDPIGWTVTGLPTGLTASPSGRTVTISGTPSVTGAFSVVAVVNDAAGSTASRTIPIVVNAVVTQPTGTLPDWTISRDYGMRTLTTTDGTAPIGWTVSGLPTGLVATPSGRSLSIAGTPTATGTFTVSTTVTDAAGSTASASFPVTINAGLSAPSGTLPDWTINRNYGTRTISTTGGTNPVVWTVAGLPSGLSTTANARLLDVSGTPDAVGTNTLTLTATDAAGATAVRTFTIVVNAAITTPTGSLPDWTIGRDYLTRTLTTTDGTDPIVWSVTNLPPGLRSTPTSRMLTITGVPSAAGSYDVNVTATDAAGSSASRSIRVNVNPALTEPAGVLPAWTVDRPYGTRTISTTGGTAPYTWSVSGLAQLGLTELDTGGASCELSGTPATSGSFIVLASVTDAAGASKSSAWSVTINSALALATSSGTTLPAWTVAQDYTTRTITASGGTDAVALTLSGALPPGLNASISGRTMQITGTPTTRGEFSFSADATDAAGAVATLPITITINDPVEIATAQLRPWTVGRDYAEELTASGGTLPLRWEMIYNNNAQLAFDRAAAPPSYHGKPTVPGSYTAVFRVTDAAGSTTDRSFDFVINPGIELAARNLLFGAAGAEYTDFVAASSGTAPYTYTSSDKPSWMLVDATSGVLSGTPPSEGTFDFVVQATDSAGASVPQTYHLEVAHVVSLADVTGVPLTVPPGDHYLVAYDALVGSTPSLKFRRPDGQAMPYTFRLLHADGTAHPTKRSLKAVKLRGGVSIALPTAAQTDRYFLMLETAAPAATAFDMTVAPHVTIKRTFTAKITIPAGGMTAVPFAAPDGYIATVRFEKKGSSVTLSRMTHVRSATGPDGTSDPHSYSGPTFPPLPITAWGDYVIDCGTIDGTALTTRYTVTLTLPKKTRIR